MCVCVCVCARACVSVCVCVYLAGSKSSNEVPLAPGIIDQGPKCPAVPVGNGRRAEAPAARPLVPARYLTSARQ